MSIGSRRPTTDQPATREAAAAPRATAAAPATEPAATTGAPHRRPVLAAGLLAMPRSRGALSGLSVFVFGVWGAIVPFVGPYFHYAYINHTAWSFPTYGRLWLEILPGALAALAGLELMRSANRPTAIVAGVSAAIAGAWFIVGPVVSTLWNHGAVQAGRPLGGTLIRAIEQLGYFYALGAAILFLGALALGRVATRSVRDGRVLAERRAARTTVPPAAA
jgi:hypothetical protein